MDPHVKKIISQARLKLIKNDLNFFGLFAGKFVWQVYEFDDKLNAEGCVFLEPDARNPKKEVIGNAIHINEKYAKRKDYDYMHLVRLVLHELLHIINKHGIRRGGRDPMLWNVAGDHVIDRFLQGLNMGIKAYHQFNIIPDLHKALPSCSCEEAYEWLDKNRTKYTVSFNPETGMIEVEDNHGNKFEISPNQGGQDEKNSSDPKARQQIETLVAEARAIHEATKDRGMTPAGIVSYLDDVLQVEIPWQSLLEIAIKTNVIMKPDDRGWRNPNKRLRCHGFTLPGEILTETNEGVGTLIVHVDTSGSMSEKQLKEASFIICESMRYFKRIKLITADATIHQEQDFDSDNIGEFLNYIKTEGYKGRGGTSHKDVFDRVQEVYDEDRDELSMFISITDGYSDIEHLYVAYDFVKDSLPMVILLSENHRQLTLNPDIGKIKQIVMHDN